MTDTLDRRALNRATLARQLLLERSALPASAAVHRLAGLNGQDAIEPYLMLWSRLASFRPPDLTALRHDRTACAARWQHSSRRLGQHHRNRRRADASVEVNWCADMSDPVATAG